MIYFSLVFLLIISVYPFSYVGYVWRKKNYMGALALLFLTLISIAYPAYLLFQW